jgi:hypothetical protein
MSIADDLQTAGLVVIETRRPNIGRTADVSGVEVRSTNTGKSHEGAGDINNVVKPAGGVAYVERSGRVWLLADGPTQPGPAVVFEAQYRDDTTDEQADAVQVVIAVLEDHYALTGAPVAPNAVESELQAVEDSEEDEG